MTAFHPDILSDCGTLQIGHYADNTPTVRFGGEIVPRPDERQSLFFELPRSGNVVESHERLLLEPIEGGRIRLVYDAIFREGLDWYHSMAHFRFDWTGGAALKTDFRAKNSCRSHGQASRKLKLLNDEQEFPKPITRTLILVYLAIFGFAVAMLYLEFS